MISIIYHKYDKSFIEIIPFTASLECLANSMTMLIDYLEVIFEFKFGYAMKDFVFNFEKTCCLPETSSFV